MAGDLLGMTEDEAPSFIVSLLIILHFLLPHGTNVTVPMMFRVGDNPFNGRLDLYLP